MNDKRFLQWVHDRLLAAEGCSPNVDYLHKLRSIIAVTPEEQDTPAILGGRPPHPCIGMCTATALGDPVCAGCHRTAEEVRDWNQYTDEQKFTIISRIKRQNPCQ